MGAVGCPKGLLILDASNPEASGYDEKPEDGS